MVACKDYGSDAYSIKKEKKERKGEMKRHSGFKRIRKIYMEDSFLKCIVTKKKTRKLICKIVLKTYYI